MIEEQGRVVAVESGAVWVETQRQTTCGGCSANAGCGQGLMDKLGVRASRNHVRALCDLQLQVGDHVVLGIAEGWLLRSAALVYLMPLLLFFLMVGVAHSLGAAEPWVILAGGLGLLVGWTALRWLNRRLANQASVQPVVIRAMVSCVLDAGQARTEG